MRTTEEYKLLEYAHKIRSYCAGQTDCRKCIFFRGKNHCHLIPEDLKDLYYFAPSKWFSKRTEVENESTL